MRCTAKKRTTARRIFMQINKRRMSTQKLALGAILTALVIVLQLLPLIKLGPFQISLVLIPIIIGAATCGTAIGAWLGFIFGIVVLINGDAAAFLAVNVFGTILTVLLKGTACGFMAGIIFKLLEKLNRYVGVIVAAIVCPITNTGIFLIGCRLFFWETVNEWAATWCTAMGYENVNVGAYVILGLVGGNFLVELASGLLLSPIVVRILDMRKKK